MPLRAFSSEADCILAVITHASSSFIDISYGYFTYKQTSLSMCLAIQNSPVHYIECMFTHQLDLDLG